MVQRGDGTVVPLVPPDSDPIEFLDRAVGVVQRMHDAAVPYERMLRSADPGAVKASDLDVLDQMHHGGYVELAVQENQLRMWRRDHPQTETLERYAAAIEACEALFQQIDRLITSHRAAHQQASTTR